MKKYYHWPGLWVILGILWSAATVFQIVEQGFRWSAVLPGIAAVLSFAWAGYQAYRSRKG